MPEIEVRLKPRLLPRRDSRTAGQRTDEREARGSAGAQSQFASLKTETERKLPDRRTPPGFHSARLLPGTPERVYGCLPRSVCSRIRDAVPMRRSVAFNPRAGRAG